MKCMKENYVGSGIQRPNIKEIDHVKTMWCLCSGLEEKTQNLEVRYCDDFNERMERARILRKRYYA